MKNSLFTTEKQKYLSRIAADIELSVFWGLLKTPQVKTFEISDLIYEPNLCADFKSYAGDLPPNRLFDIKNDKIIPSNGNIFREKIKDALRSILFHDDGERDIYDSFDYTLHSERATAAVNVYADMLMCLRVAIATESESIRAYKFYTAIAMSRFKNVWKLVIRAVANGENVKRLMSPLCSDIRTRTFLESARAEKLPTFIEFNETGPNIIREATTVGSPLLLPYIVALFPTPKYLICKIFSDVMSSCLDI